MIDPLNGYSPALLRAMQDGRTSSALLSSLRSVSDSFLPGSSRPVETPQRQSLAARPTLALLETMQAGRQSSALPTRQNGGSAGFVNPRVDLARAEEMISATQIGQPSIADSRIGHKAYLVEIQARSQVEQRSMGSAWMQEWFA